MATRYIDDIVYVGNRGCTLASDLSFASKADADASAHAGRRDRSGLRYGERPKRRRDTADEFIALQASGKLN